MRAARTFTSAADPAGLGALLTFDLDDEGEHVVRITIDLDDPSQTTVEGPPLVLLIDEGLIVRRVPLTAHGIAAQVRGPAVLSIEDDPTVTLRPAAGTWRGQLDVRPGRVVEELVTHAAYLNGGAESVRYELPFGSTSVTIIDSAYMSHAIALYTPLPAPVYGRAEIWDQGAERAPFAVPRGAARISVMNGEQQGVLGVISVAVAVIL